LNRTQPAKANVVDLISARKRITSHPRKTRAQRRVRFPPSPALIIWKQKSAARTSRNPRTTYH